MKKVLIALLLCSVAEVWAQSHRFEAGLRVGTAEHLDLTYTYFAGESAGLEMGFLTGVSFGYTFRRPKTTLDERFSPTIPGYKDVKYRISGTVRSVEQQVQVEVPLMMAMRYGQWYINAGARVISPVLYDRWSQQIDDLKITATINGTAHTPNDPITGYATPQQKNMSGSNPMTYVRFAASAEAGYDFTIGGDRSGYDIQNMIGIGLYIDYSFYTLGQTPAPVGEKAVVVDPIPVPAVVTTHRIVNSEILTKIPDIGIRFRYSLLADGTTHNGRHSSSRYGSSRGSHKGSSRSYGRTSRNRSYRPSSRSWY